jgi:hypothetical protein
MLVVHGIYDGKVVRLLEPIQVESPYRVKVTFLEPLGRDTPTTGEDSLERFIGMWVDFTPDDRLCRGSLCGRLSDPGRDRLCR